MDNSIVNRSTLDKTEISGHGRDLLSFCKATGFRIVNGRVGDDYGIGNFTCRTGSSLVDYCLMREKNFHLINNFSVGEINTFSDHPYLQLRLKINVHPENIGENNASEINMESNEDPNITSLREDYNYKYIINEDYKQKVRLCLNSNEIKDELDNLKSNVSNGNMSADDMIIKLRQLCVKISNKTLTKIFFLNLTKK